MLLAHRIRLDPNNVQRTYFARAAGTARFAYNWALAEWGRQYAASKADPTLKPPNEAALRRQLNSIKREQFPWMLDVTNVCIPDGDHAAGTCVREFPCPTRTLPDVSAQGD